MMPELSNLHRLSKSELTDFIKQIDWKPVEEYMKETFGIETELSVEIRDSKFGATYAYVFSEQELVDKCGLFSFCLNSVRLQSAGSGVVQDVLEYDQEKYEALCKNNRFDFSWDDVAAKFSEPHMWLSMELRFETADFGRNGVLLFDATYTKSKGWSFSAEK